MIPSALRTLRTAGLAALLAIGVGCSRQPCPFTVEVMNPMTPVKDQGKSELCWAYAMLAAIETEHIGRGDSVNLSATYVGRMTRAWGHGQRGMGHTLLHALEEYGLVGYDVYPDDATDELPLPQQVFMLGARYTPREFAHSVCAPGEYIALTTTPEAPYGEEVELRVPDNWEHNRFLNLPPDSLAAHVEWAVRHRHGVCWEGDTHEPGFSFKKGVADRHDASAPTDNHCMAIVGLARDPQGRLFYIMKNSWGTHNPYGGLMYMSASYLHDKTIAIYMTKDAYQHD